MQAQNLPHRFEYALYRTAEIRDIEARALASTAPGALMRAAGAAAAQLARHLAGTPDRPILVLAGPGNNGGDALACAGLLAQAGYTVTALLCTDTANYSADATAALASARDSGVHFADENACFDQSANWSLIIDGLFGIGLTRAIAGPLAQLIERLNNLTTGMHIPVLALDLPSGLNGDTGQVSGESGVAVRASHTITYIADKPGLHTGAGRDYAGEVTVATLGIEPALYPEAQAYLIDEIQLRRLLGPRRHDSHKGSYGDVVLIGGARGMTGALLLGGRTALHCGAGRVLLGFLENAPAYDCHHPELMCRDAQAVCGMHAGLVIGPGLGGSAAALALLRQAIASDSPLVIDADGLNLLATNPGLQEELSKRNRPTILTPHPLEAARLLAVQTNTVQSDRLAAARTLAQKFNAVTILKGSGSIVCAPESPLLVNTTGNPALASAGTGDVLAGACGALLAQGLHARDAAALAAWLHGRAADTLCASGVGPIGLCASELIPEIRRQLNRLAESG